GVGEFLDAAEDSLAGVGVVGDGLGGHFSFLSSSSGSWVIAGEEKKPQMERIERMGMGKGEERGRWSACCSSHFLSVSSVPSVASSPGLTCACGGRCGPRRRALSR